MFVSKTKSVEIPIENIKTESLDGSILALKDQTIDCGIGKAIGGFNLAFSTNYQIDKKIGYEFVCLSSGKF